MQPSMPRPRRWQGLLVIVMLVLILQPSWAVAPEGRDYLVIGESLPPLTFAETIDGYGSFATAHLTPARAMELTGRGFIVEALDRTVGRGAHRVDPRDAPNEGTDSTRYVVQFRGPIKPEWRQNLESAVDRIYDYLPHHAYIITLGHAGPGRIHSIPGVRAVIPYGPAFKVSQELPPSGEAAFTVLLFPDAPLDAFLATIGTMGLRTTGVATTQLEHIVDVMADVTIVPQLAAMEDVAWIEPAYDDGSLDNEEASSITQSGTLEDWTVHERGIDGRSQIVSICDTGANTDVGSFTTRPAFRMVHEAHDDVGGTGLLAYNAHIMPATVPLPPHRKVDLYYSPQENGNRGDATDDDGHGTHTSATLAGDAPPYGIRNAHDGIAYASRLQICDIAAGNTFHILADYSHYWDPAYERGARVSSNSWGSTPTNAYTEKARQHDAYVRDHRDFLIFRSMGNDGPQGVMRPEAAAKSVIAVGATYNGDRSDTISPSSTGGPTLDGRLKPDVVAPGRCLVSAYLPGPTSYECLSGTSMSTPLVAGAAALVRDYFARGFYPSGRENPVDAQAPSAALVRAILAAAGREISGDRGLASFPNAVQGFGRVTLDDVLYFDSDTRALAAWDEAEPMQTGEVREYKLDVAAGQSLHVVLAWSDAPGAAGANPALVNDLDLALQGPGGRFYPATAASGHPGRQPVRDDRNVIEIIHVLEPKAGTYTVRILAANVADGPQPFSLVATGILEAVALDAEKLVGFP